MRYLEFKKALEDFTVFSVGEIEKIDSRFHRRRLSEWQDKGYIKKVIKGYYVFSDLELNENVLFEIANRIHRPSYISLEMALSYHQLVPESTYAVTSISSRRPCKYETPVATFIYRKMKPGLFFGYELVEYRGRQLRIASPEKAILDYFYLNPHLKSLTDFDSLRLDAHSFRERIDGDKVYAFLKRFSQKRLHRRIDSFLHYMKNA